MKALVTGFDAFGGDKVNPSSLAVGRLKKRIGGIVVHTAELPTSYAQSAERAARRRSTKVQPDIVLCVGQAGGRTELCLERVAINVQDARIRDNDGKQPIDRPVVKDGPAAHFATLPIKACVAEMRKAGLPAAVSNTAGTFVCNHIFYALMDIAPSHPIADARRLPAHSLRAGAGRPAGRRAVDGARRHRARHRDHPRGQRQPQQRPPHGRGPDFLGDLLCRDGASGGRASCGRPASTSAGLAAGCLTRNQAA